MIDSVFSPIISQFAEKPLIPVTQIEQAQDRLYDLYSAQFIGILEAETQAYLERMDDALADGDVRTINASQWPAASQLSQSLQALWADGFALGGEQGIAEMQAAVEDAQEFSRVRRFAVPLDVQRGIDAILNLEPPQLINTDAVEAVIGRVNLLVGDFADDVFLDLRKHLVAAIVPQVDTGEPISRTALLQRIQKTLEVSKFRSTVITRTELTYAYNQGRLASYNESDLVDYVRFLAISDDRTTDICKSRDGMIIEKADGALVTANTPPLHYSCRSTLSPVMSRLSRFEEMVTDPTRDPKNRELAPLLKGWRTD